MTRSPGNKHQQTTLVCRNLGTITYRDRKRETGGCVTITFDTSNVTDLGADIISRVANAMQRQLKLSKKPEIGNGTMRVRITGGHSSQHVTEVINDFFDGLRNADTRVPNGMTSSPSPRQQPQRRVATGRRRR